MDYLYSVVAITNKSVLADIGYGTGILTRRLLEKGNTVYAVEPNDNMRRTAEQSLCDYRNFVSVCGIAKNTTLADQSIDFITVAQNMPVGVPVAVKYPKEVIKGIHNLPTKDYYDQYNLFNKKPSCIVKLQGNLQNKDF